MFFVHPFHGVLFGQRYPNLVLGPDLLPENYSIPHKAGHHFCAGIAIATVGLLQYSVLAMIHDETETAISPSGVRRYANHAQRRR